MRKDPNFRFLNTIPEFGADTGVSTDLADLLSTLFFLPRLSIVFGWGGGGGVGPTGTQFPRRPNTVSSPIQRGNNSHVGNNKPMTSSSISDVRKGHSSSVARATGLVAEVPPSDVVISSNESSDRSTLDSITSPPDSGQIWVHRSP